jgi:hypothetical protein
LHDAAVLQGPDVLFSTRKGIGGRPAILATIDRYGELRFPAVAGRRYATVMVPNVAADDAAIAKALQSGRAVPIGPWSEMAPSHPAEAKTHSVVEMSQMSRSPVMAAHRFAFMFDLVVVPKDMIAKELEQFAARVKSGEAETAKPHFGEDLEKQPEAWLSPPGWKFTPDGLLATGGDIGLLDGEGYEDYRMEFDLTLPEQGQGISGWVVRASEQACLMFQLQSADSTFNEPKYKTRPNTLRPHIGRNGHWEMLEPVTLPKEVRRGQSHHIAVDCRQGTVEVFLDGQSVYKKTGLDLRGGTVGLRVTGPGEQGLFRKISLGKLE